LFDFSYEVLSQLHVPNVAKVVQVALEFKFIPAAVELGRRGGQARAKALTFQAAQGNRNQGF
jgi:hypothetical protein